MTVETENNAKAEYFSAHGFTKARLHRREKALLSIHKALDDAIRYVDAVEEEYDSFLMMTMIFPWNDWNHWNDCSAISYRE